MPMSRGKLFRGFLCGVTLLAGGACAKKPLTPQEVVQEARELARVGQIDDAILRLEAYLRTNPNAVPIVEELANLAIRAGDPMSAALYYDQVASMQPRDPSALIFAASALQEAGDMRGAILRYQQYLQRAPESAGAWAALAELYQSQGQRREAAEAYQQAYQRQNRAVTALQIGDLYLQLGNFAQAQSWFALAAESVDPDARRAALLGLVDTARRANRLQDAAHLTATIDAEYPDARLDPAIATFLGPLPAPEPEPEAEPVATAEPEESALPEAESPEAEPETPLAVDEDLTDGSLLAESPSEPEPLPVLEPVPLPEPPAESIELPDEPELAEASPPEELAPAEPVWDLRSAPYEEQLAYAREQRAAGNWLDALQGYTRALTRDDRDPLVWFELSDTHYRAGQLDWARASAQEAARRAPDDAKYALQVIRVQQQNLSAAQLIGLLDGLRQRFPESPEVTLTLARAYRTLTADTRSARVLYERFLDLAPLAHPQRAAAEQELANLQGGR